MKETFRGAFMKMSAMILTGGWSLGFVAESQAQPQPRPEIKRGLLHNDPGAFQGYTLFAPLDSKTTYLIDMEGRAVHTWESNYSPGNSAYLLPDGSLLRCARDHDSSFRGGGIGGRIQRFDWEGHLLWNYSHSNGRYCHHHDIEPMPDGNILLVAWERKTAEEALAAGRDPASVSARGELWPDYVVEIEPEGRDGGRIAWEWHAWDHLIQEVDPRKPNYGKVKDHPERIDVNYRSGATRMTRQEAQRLRGLGYLDGEDEEEEDDRAPGGPGRGNGADWLHVNAIDYNPDLDQIALSVLGFNEIWVIDHGTTTKEAASSSGGRRGRGGDLLYRWGNPHAHGAGGPSDQRLFAQHDAQWIEKGLPGAGHLLVFNNGRGRSDGDYSSVEEIAPRMDEKGGYVQPAGQTFPPPQARWSYTAPDKKTFFSDHISGAQRLPNGNTLICSGEQGYVFEVTPEGEKVWEYRNPFLGEVPEEPRGPGGRLDGPPGRFGNPPGGLGGSPSGRVGGSPEGGVGDSPPEREGDAPREREKDPPAGRLGSRPPGGFPPRGPMPGRGGPGDRGALFRATRLAPDHPGLSRLKTESVETTSKKTIESPSESARTTPKETTESSSEPPKRL